MNLQTSPAKPAGSRERSLDEVKTEFMRRVGRLSPFEEIRRDDAERVMSALKSLDKDEWAAEWSKIGIGYEDKADACAKDGAKDNAKDRAELAELYMHAFDAFRVGRYPTPNSSGKLQAYKNSVRMFRKAAPYFDPLVEIIELPFGGKTLVGYLQRPQGVAKPPVVVQWGGVDGWKEDRLRPAQALLRVGVASLSIDMPGTGENPFLYSDSEAESAYLAWLDYLAKRADVDGANVAVWGGSFGAYWAARLAFVVPTLKGAVFHGGNIHYGFQKEWLIPAFTTGGATYLFGAHSLLEARSRAMGTNTLEEFLEIAPRFSLKTMGLLDKPSAPILGVNGKLDDQAPVDDIYLLMEHGAPKSARIYATGHHMGRTPGEPAGHITTTIVQWLSAQLKS
jgi:pimeloyl-ACP methyl ester carboxylesterase